jgi:uncharacterized protein (DUF2141 family)
MMAFILYGCAQQFMPTGGPVDKTPPLLVASDPGEKEVNVQTKRIRLTFDEYIKEEKLKEQLIISPSIDNTYQSTVRRNEMILEFEKELDSATTFTFNFRAGITDITEGNPAENVLLTFSTGPFIDSLEIIGKTIDLLSGRVQNDITVGLFLFSDTLNPYARKPRYFTKTDSSGNYELANLTPGDYVLYTWQDKNDNLQIDSKDEAHGFYPETIRLDKNLNLPPIPYLKQQADTLKVVSSRPAGREFLIRFNKYLRDYELVPEDSTLDLYYRYENESQAIRVYNTFPELVNDSLQVKVVASDSMLYALEETLFISFNEESSAEKEQLEWRSIPTGPAKIRENEEVQLLFTKPMLKMEMDSLFSMVDSVFTYYELEESLQFNAGRTRAKAYFNRDSLREGKTLTYVIPEGLQSVDGDTLDRLLITFELKQGKDYGSIKGKVEGVADDQNFIIQLLNPAGQVQREIPNQKEYSFELVEPGSYTVRVLIDANGDGIWNAGNGFIRRAPEPVYHYEKPNPEKGEDPRTIILRANWELSDINIRVDN